MENKFPGKNGIGELPLCKTALRKTNLQQAGVTPLRTGKKKKAILENSPWQKDVAVLWKSKGRVCLNSY